MLYSILSISHLRPDKTVYSLKFANLDATEPDLIAVVLKQDIALFGLAEIFKVFVFAFAYQLAVLLAAPFVFEHLEAVEPVFNVAVQGDDVCRIPLTHSVEPLVGRRYKVIE